MALIVLNPNSSSEVSRGIAEALTPFARFGTEIRVLTLAEGPPGIENQRQADLTIAPMLRLAAAQKDAAGFVIACFGDPGLHALRDQTPLPVVGIQEAGVLQALSLGQRFGVIAILPASIPRHLRAFGAMGVTGRLAGDRALGLGVADLAREETTRAAMIRTAQTLRDVDGADVLVLGCAGMARYRAAIETAVGLPVVEPCQAATALALGQIAVQQTRAPKGAKQRSERSDRHA